MGLLRALEMALYRTFCAPTTSALLDRTREFQDRAQRRYDDTSLLMVEIVEWGYDSDRGKELLARINRFHRTYDIANDDFLYVLSTFHLEPVRWIARFGWRSLTPNEVQASYFFWREVGRRMNIRDIPPSHEEFERWSLDHERTCFAYSDSNRRVARATRELFVGWAPRPLRDAQRFIRPFHRARRGCLKRPLVKSHADYVARKYLRLNDLRVCHPV